MTAAGWRGEFAALFPAALFDEPLSKHTTFHIGGPADALVTARSIADLTELFAFSKKRRLPVFPVGWGSNLLVRDGGIRGIVLKFAGDFEEVRFAADDSVWTGAAVRLPNLVMQCAEQGLTGAEPLVGVPGCVGGALVMNAGTRQGEIGDLVRSVEIFEPKTLQAVVLPKAEIRFAYRSSSLQKSVLTGAVLELRRGSKVDIIEIIKKFQQQRLKTQPVHSFNVGSVFKNPKDNFAAKLIEESGFKGRPFGGARVSPKHANFIENFAGAKASDVLALVGEIQAAVKARTGVELEPEMKVVGEA